MILSFLQGISDKDEINEWENLMAYLLTGKDLKYKNKRGEIKIPNSYEKKANFVRRVFYSICDDKNPPQFNVFIGNEFKTIEAREYLNNRLDCINEKIANNELQIKIEFNWKTIIFCISMLLCASAGLAWQSWLVASSSKNKKIAQSLGFGMIVFVSICIVLILDVYCGSLAAILSCILYLLINMFLTMRFFHNQKCNLCKKFQNEYQKIKNFINARDEEDAEIEISESEPKENNRLNNNQLLQVPNSVEYIIVFNHDENNSI